MKLITLSLSIIFSALSFAQDFFYKNYDWNETPETFTLTEEEKKQDDLILKYKKVIHLVSTDDKLFEYHLTHKIIKLNTDKGIEKNNKYYVANGGSIEVKMQKARVITPSGKVINLSEKDIIDSKDEEGNLNYQYFAFEGVEIGSVIEYLDLVAYPPQLKGGYLTIQGSTIRKNVEIEIVSPKHIEYLTYPINGLTNFVKDSTQIFNQRIFMNIPKVDALEEESWSSWNANLQKVYYKFNKNTNTGKANFYTYNNVAVDLHERYFAALNKKEKSAVTKFLKKSGALTMTGTEAKVRQLENYMKHEIAVIDQYFEQAEDLSFVLEKKITTDNGFYKLIINCLREMEIPFELVMTCDRYDDKFLTEYEAYNFLQEFLIYVKDIDKYLSHNLVYRLGFVPDNFINNKGLFVSEVKIGDLNTGVGKVKFIKGTKKEESVDELNTVTTIADDFMSVNVDVERISSGYKAQPYQGIISLLNDEQKLELKNEYLAYIDNEVKPENMSFENDSCDLLGQKPFIGKGTIKSDNFIEKAGDNYLFKVGMLIGPQAELYNEKARKMPVENGTPRMYVRKIVVNIPQGYTVKNPEVLTIDLQPDKTANSLGFISKYSITGNQLTVEIKEWYANYNYTVAEYPNYEKVINASADFNKLVLVLQAVK